MSQFKGLIKYLRKAGSCTLQDVADANRVTVTEAWAYFMSLHDYGLVTVYGRSPASLVRMDAPDDPWIVAQVA